MKIFRNSIKFFFYGLFIFYPLLSGASSESDSTEILPYKLTGYDIKVYIPETFDRFKVMAGCSIENSTGSTPDTVSLILGKRSFGVKPEVTGVNNGENNALDYSWEEPNLKIEIPEKLGKMEELKLYVEYELRKDSEYYDDRYSPFAFETSDSLCHINAAITRNDNWYPKVERTLYERLPEFNLRISVPLNLEVMASGQLAGTEVKENRKIYYWENYPEITDRSLYFFASERIKKIKNYPDGFRIVMYLPEDTCSETLKEVTDIIYRSFKFFKSNFGEVPGNEYKIMAFPYGFSGLYRSMTAPVSLFTERIKNSDIFYPSRTIIHEVSHTWWGNKVSADTRENYWMFEGFAKYSEIIGIKAVGGPDIEDFSFSRLKLSTIPYLGKVPAIWNSGKEENRTLQRVSSYYMGATFLRMLQYASGEQKFFKAMREYTDEFSGKCINTEVFIDFMEDYLSEPEQDLLDKYLKNPGYSRYIVKEIYDNDGKITGFSVTNSGDKPILSPYTLLCNEKKESGRIFLPVNANKIVKCENKSETGNFKFTMDPLNIYPVIEENICGAGGMVYRNSEGKILFINIVDGTPLSNAGVEDGMILVDIEGESLEDMNLGELNKLLQRESGSKLEINIENSRKDTIEVILNY